LAASVSLLAGQEQNTIIYQKGLTEPKKRVLLKCGLSMGAMTGKLQNLHNMKNESLLCP